MILQYFKQAIRSIRQNKLFSVIYITGTALAIASTTVFAIIYYVKLAPVYPEYNRPLTAKLVGGYLDPEHTMTKGIDYNVASDYLANVENAKTVAMVFNYYSIPKRVAYNDNRSYLDADVKLVDPQYFSVFPFEFIDGRPFNQSEFESGAPVIVISDLIATKVFGSTDGVVGKAINLNYKDYTITGVFREGSRLCSNSFAEMLLPYTVIPYYNMKPDLSRGIFTGTYDLIYLTDNFDGLQSELNDIARRFNSATGEGNVVKYYFDNCLKDNFALAFEGDRMFNRADNSISEIIRKVLFILFVLLIVPALNLSGIIAGNMEERQGEISVRKSFGATNDRMLNQVLWENMVLTLLGGIVGLIAAWLIIYFGSNWIFVSVGDFIIPESSDIRINPDMLFAPAVFAFSFALCLIFNLLSALVPVKLAVRKPIAETLNSK